MSKEGYVHFFSEAPLENIEAVNNKAAGVIDFETGNFAFRIQIQDFIFEKSLMQEHFNENYMESERFPISTFIGHISDFQTLDLTSQQTLSVSGEFFLHGITKNISVIATLFEESQHLKLNASFVIKLEDYDIDIPTVVMYKIAEEIKIDIRMQLNKKE